MRLILFGGYPSGKVWKNMEKRPFFRGAMVGLGEILHGPLRPDWGLYG